MKGKFQPYVDIEKPRNMTELLQIILDKKIAPLNTNYDFKTWSGGPTGWAFIETDPNNDLTYSLAQVDDGMEITFTKAAAGTNWVYLFFMINSYVAVGFTYLANRKYVVVVDYTVTEGQNLAYYSQIRSTVYDFARSGLGYLFNVWGYDIPLNFRTQVPSLIVQFPYNTPPKSPHATIYVCRIEFHDSATCDPLKVVIHSIGLYDVTDFV